MWRLIENKAWGALQEKFDWVRDMESVVQDSKHHAEGNVATHTQMVLSALQDLPEFQGLNTDNQEIIWTAALMHDVEKRSTTVIEPDGSVTSAGHAKKGEKTTRSLLYRVEKAPFVTREAIAKLVRYHGLPLWIFEKPNPQKTLLKASLEVNTAWLAMLAKADILGRICEDQQELLYRIELFKELCMEQGCWGIPRGFSSEMARFSYFQKDNQSPDYQPFEHFSTTVVVLSGLPGSGKDSYIQKHYADWPVVSLDAIRKANKIEPTDKKANGWVIQTAKEQARQLLRTGTPFIWNATNITFSLREQLIQLFVTYKAQVNLIYLEVPFEKLIKQNRNREAVVPEMVIRQLIHKLDVPAVWEAHTVTYVVQT